MFHVRVFSRSARTCIPTWCPATRLSLWRRSPMLTWINTCGTLEKRSERFIFVKVVVIMLVSIFDMNIYGMNIIEFPFLTTAGMRVIIAISSPTGWSLQTRSQHHCWSTSGARVWTTWQMSGPLGRWLIFLEPRMELLIHQLSGFVGSDLGKLIGDDMTSNCQTLVFTSLCPWCF